MLQSTATIWFLGSVGVIVTFGYLGWLSVRRSPKRRDDPSGLIGCQAVAQETFTLDGLVLIRGELWRATSDVGIIQKGATVEVKELRPGLVLLVHVVKE